MRPQPCEGLLEIYVNVTDCSMSQVNPTSEPSSGVAVAQDTFTLLPGHWIRDRELEDASNQAIYLVLPAPLQSEHATGELIEQARLARSPEGRGTASCEEFKACAVDVSASSIDEKLKQLKASASWLEDSINELEAENGRLRASSRRLHAAVQVEEFETKKLADELRQEARLMKYCRALQFKEDAAASLQALQEYGRAIALAQVGICSRVLDGGGVRMTNLVQDWALASQMLTGAHKQEIAARFGSHFMSFLAPGALGMAQASSTVTLWRGMPWAERDFIMETIDSLEPEAVREGGRSAYMAFFGCISWEQELKIVNDRLAA